MGCGAVFRPVAMNCADKLLGARDALLLAGTMGVAPATVTVTPVGTVTLTPPPPATGF